MTTSSSIEDHESNHHQVQHVSIRDRLSHFTWAWFEVTMSTGAIAVLLEQQPFGFHGLITIGKIFFILDVVLFLTFCCLITFRFSMDPSAFTTSLHHPHESFFFGTFWVSIALILYNTQLYGTPVCGPWLVKALQVCFWLYAGLVLLVTIFQYHVIFDLERMPVEDAMPAWIFPAYPNLLTGPLAAALLYSQPYPGNVAILIGGLVFQGLGWMLALLMYSLYFTRLVSRDLPEAPKRPGMYVAVGPCAYTASALITLGSQAPKVLPRDYLGITTIPVGEIWKAFGIAAGLFLWLTGFWFFAVATISVVMVRSKAHFTLNYWAFIFPNAGLTVAAIQIGNVLESTGIKAVTSAMTILLVGGWILISIATIRALYLRQILWPGKDEDEEDIEGHERDEGKERLE